MLIQIDHTFTWVHEMPLGQGLIIIQFLSKDLIHTLLDQIKVENQLTTVYRLPNNPQTPLTFTIIAKLYLFQMK